MWWKNRINISDVSSDDVSVTGSHFRKSWIQLEAGRLMSRFGEYSDIATRATSEVKNS
jgi:hypothetical protein